jgi:hypothetical protein
VVGDDWSIAVAVAVAAAATALLARTGAASYWLVPAVVIAALAASLWRAAGR